MSRRALWMLAAVWLLAGCASRGAEEPVHFEAANDVDPLESINRPIFSANDALDRYVLNPVATGWDRITPRSIPRHIEQLFDNLRTPGWALNDLLQGDVRQAGVEGSRFLLNSSVGLAGLFDPARHFFELEGRVEDFGQTLGLWGVPPGAYVMLPVLGPSGARELAALPVDLALDPLTWVPWAYRLGANTANQINRRSLRLDEVKSARESAFDLYSSLRDGYRQLRRNLILNGNASEEASDDLYELDEGDLE